MRLYKVLSSPSRMQVFKWQSFVRSISNLLSNEKQSSTHQAFYSERNSSLTRLIAFYFTWLNVVNKPNYKEICCDLPRRKSHKSSTILSFWSCCKFLACDKIFQLKKYFLKISFFFPTWNPLIFIIFQFLFH